MGYVILLIAVVILLMFFGRQILEYGIKGIVKLLSMLFSAIGRGLKALFSMIFKK